MKWFSRKSSAIDKLSSGPSAKSKPLPMHDHPAVFTQQNMDTLIHIMNDVCRGSKVRWIKDMVDDYDYGWTNLVACENERILILVERYHSHYDGSDDYSFSLHVNHPDGMIDVSHDPNGPWRDEAVSLMDEILLEHANLLNERAEQNRITRDAASAKAAQVFSN